MKNDRKLYLQTLYNDIYQSTSIGLRYGKRDRYLFGDSRLPSFIQRNIFILYTMSFVFPLLYFIYLMIAFFKALYKIIYTNSCELYEGSYFMATGNFSYSLNLKINRYASLADWIINSDIMQNKYSIPNKCFSIYSLVTIKELIEVFCDSVVILFCIYRKYGKYYELFALNSFNWLLYKKSVDKIPYNSVVYFIDHKDRWALLEDKLRVKDKILIQHGTEISTQNNNLTIEFSKGRYCQNLPYKFHTLTKIYAFSEIEFEAIIHSIVACMPMKIIAGFDFVMDDISIEKYSILIVGHAFYYGDIEKELLERLQCEDITVYLKNHPTQNPDFYLPLMNLYKFIFVNENFFPKVNLVISYESTLANEYQSVGVEVVYHTKKSIDEILKHVKQHMNYDIQAI